MARVGGTGNREDTSKRIGVKLLSGWTLLAEACPRSGCAAPLLRAPPPLCSLFCPQHDGAVEAAELAASAEEAPASRGHNNASYDAAAHADASVLGPYASAAALPPHPVGRGAASGPHPVHPPLPPSDEQASSIADLLLAGWAMTASFCPIEGCLAPLMRNKEQQLCAATAPLPTLRVIHSLTRLSGGRLCPAHKLWVVSAPHPAAPAVAEEDEESEASLRGVIAAKDAELAALRAQVEMLSKKQKT